MLHTLLLLNLFGSMGSFSVVLSCPEERTGVERTASIQTGHRSDFGEQMSQVFRNLSQFCKANQSYHSDFSTTSSNLGRRWQKIAITRRGAYHQRINRSVPFWGFKMMKPCVFAMTLTLALAAPAPRDSCVKFLPALWPRTDCLGYVLPNAACEASPTSVSHFDVLQPESGLILKRKTTSDHVCLDGWQYVDEYECSSDKIAVVEARFQDGCVVTTKYRSSGACGLAADPHSCAPIPVPTPTAEQLNYQLSELVVRQETKVAPVPHHWSVAVHSSQALTHFNMATYGIFQGCTDLNWLWLQYPKTFQPSKLNVSNWIQAYQDFGAKGAVLTAKHGCGFTLWPTQAKIDSENRHSEAVVAVGSVRLSVRRPNSRMARSTHTPCLGMEALESTSFPSL
jgi:hypothetical protein